MEIIAFFMKKVLMSVFATPIKNSATDGTVAEKTKTQTRLFES
jgi:hypothetical protein